MLVGCCAPALLFNTVTVFPANAPIPSAVRLFRSIVLRFVQSSDHRRVNSHPSSSLVQSTAAQIVCNDDIGDSIEYKLNVVGICGTRHVAVDFF